MKSPAIPEIVDPSKCCDKRLIYEGFVAFSRLPRFLAAQSGEVDSSSVVRAKYRFRRDEQRLKIAELQFSANAILTCQRCLKLLDIVCAGSTNFVFCRDNLEAEQAPKGYEPALVSANSVSLWHLLEDELLLSLPMFANHEDVHCNTVLNGLRSEAKEQAGASPFAVLSELLKK